MFTKTIQLFLIFITLFASGLTCASWSTEARTDTAVSCRVPKEIQPVLGCWFWQEPEFESGGFRPFIDMACIHTPYNMLTTSLRIPFKEVTDEDVHDQIQAAASYARDHGMPLIMDLDVRLARRAFQRAYPKELQEMLLLHEETLPASGEIQVEIQSRDLTDHYTHRTTHYIPIRGSLVRVYAYIRDGGLIDGDTLQDITRQCTIVHASENSVRISIPVNKKISGHKVCAMVSFTHLTPDVFAPNLMRFQRAILRQYADTTIAGACKDEWGFPPSFDGVPEKNEFWYSRYRAEAYTKRTGGRDLVADCLLMYAGVKGRENERIAAINHFMAMSYERNSALENDFYQAVKTIFGSEAVVATHPTWWPYPDLREFKKNGLSWWAAKRDWAQTDETTPFAIRTALSKKWNSSVWYNMFYSSKKSDYEQNVWAYTLAGGRINYHPPWPEPRNLLERRRSLTRGDLFRAESRVRLLNFITKTPLDCPVAVIFGHACAMNWAGPVYNDVGMELADELWRAGFPADLIPSSEITQGHLYINNEGWIQYGPQRYKAVILYHPEFEKPSTASFFQKAAKGQTALFRMGDWTQDFDGKFLKSNTALPASMAAMPDMDSMVEEICNELRALRVDPQTPAIADMEGFEHHSASPPTKGFCRLIDGTIVHVSGTHQIAGDPIRATFNVNGRPVYFDAEGIAAVRLDEHGAVEALAAGGLKRFRASDFEIALDPPMDIVLWRKENGRFHGVAQDFNGPIPESLLAITNDWLRLSLPRKLTNGR